MGLLREWLRRLVGTFRRGRGDADLQEELRSHLEMTADSARTSGALENDAVRAAVVKYGAVAQAVEAQRDQRGISWIADAAADVRYGARQLRKHLGFSAAV